MQAQAQVGHVSMVRGQAQAGLQLPSSVAVAQHVLPAASGPPVALQQQQLQVPPAAAIMALQQQSQLEAPAPAVIGALGSLAAVAGEVLARCPMPGVK